MKAGIFFTGTGPILILTSYDSLNDPKEKELRHATNASRTLLGFEP